MKEILKAFRNYFSFIFLLLILFKEYYTKFYSSVVKNYFTKSLKRSTPNLFSNNKQIYSPIFFKTALLPFNNSANVLTNFSNN